MSSPNISFEQRSRAQQVIRDLQKEGYSLCDLANKLHIPQWDVTFAANMSIRKRKREDIEEWEEKIEYLATKKAIAAILEWAEKHATSLQPTTKADTKTEEWQKAYPAQGEVP